MPDLHEAASEIRHATFRLARRLRQQRAVATVTDGQFAVMGALRWHGPSTLTALAEREGVTAPSMNRTVDCLEAEGYITRERDEQDRRRVIISITEAGAAVVDATIVRRDEWLARALSGLDGGDRDTLRRAARIILEVVDG